MLKQLVEFVVKQLVDKPELVVIHERQEGNKKTLDIRVSAHDLKKVIGKEGRVVRAIRSMVSCIEPQETIEINLDSTQQ
jgi:predicted RNA-binding protein YlqC (UPF0109 family)